MIVRCSTQFLLLICLVSASSNVHAQTPSSPAATIEHADITLNPKGVSIDILLSAPFLPQGVSLANPDRLVFDFPGYTLRAGNRQMLINNGAVRKFRAALFQSEPPITRIVIDLKEPVNFDVKAAGNKLTIEVGSPTTSSVSAGTTRTSASVEKPKTQETHEFNSVMPAGPRMSVPDGLSQTSAYKLQDKAKDLKIEDLQSLEDKADAKDPEAETLLALAFHGGTLLKQDDAEALRLLRRAADQRYMPAEESLGIFFAMGIGMEKPAPAEALEWYKKAVQHGSLDAATNIALLYDDGVGVPRDPVQAMTWFRRAAEGGEPTAQYNLALIYSRGKDVPQDYKQSLHWLSAAAERNLLPAMLDLAAFYVHPPDGSTADIPQAIHYYQRAASLGSARAEVLLGKIYADGVEGKPDYEKAVTWYRKAADQGDADGQFGLALRYMLGQGVPLDMQEAVRLFGAAAGQGLPGAQYNLAIMYEEGKGASSDPALAAHYYQLSADRGMSQAQFRLGRLLAGKKESRADQVSAYKWLLLAENSIQQSSPILAELRKAMTPEEIKEAETEVDTWRIAHAQKPAD